MEHISDPKVIREKFNTEAARQAFDRIENALHPRWHYVETPEGVHVRPFVETYNIDGQQPFRPDNPTRFNWLSASADTAMLGHEKSILEEVSEPGRIIVAMGLGPAMPDRAFTYDKDAGSFSPISQQALTARITGRGRKP
jgi:hypothetical protein